MAKADIFKALSHPLRRKILLLIHEKGAVSYKELSALEPKPGVLYHHLRLLGDLIYQGEDKLYRLTDKGERAVELVLEVESLASKDAGINKVLTPRWLFARISGPMSYVIAVLALLSAVVWKFQSDFALFGALIAPAGSIDPALSYLISLVLMLFVPILLFKAIFMKGLIISWGEYVGRVSLPFLILSLFPLASRFLSGTTELVVYSIFQGVFILYLTAAYSVSFGLILRRSVIAPALAHYLGLIIYVVTSF